MKRLFCRRNFHLLVLSFVLVVPSALPFPENVRLGYVNCTSCHVSPNGGGILTPYGRSISGERMSEWSREGESQFLYGLFKLPEWLNLGGDFRVIQTYRDTAFLTEHRFILMQADLEAAATVKQWQAIVSFGRQEISQPHSFGEELISRRHYLMFRPDDKWSIRAGRFGTAYGLNISDHYVVTRRGLSWDQGTETYNIEGSYLGDSWDIFATLVFGRPDAPSLQRERGFALRSAMGIGDTNKIGLSYFYGTSDRGNRHVFGPFAILGLTSRFFVLAEIGFQNYSAQGSSTSQFGGVNYLRVNYEILQGLHLYGTQELARLDFNNPNRLIRSYGIGAQWFPRPHWEVSASFQKFQNIQASEHWDSVVWVLLHFYP